MSTPDEDSFLSRWSKRKLDGVPEEDVAEVAEPTADPEAAFEGKSDEEILEALELPDPDTLTSGDNFKAFMDSAVPTRLRNRALRKLWLSNPVLANLDELVDYGEDYTDAATVVENLQTAYQVGRGFVIPEEDEPAEAEVADAAGVAEDSETALASEAEEPVASTENDEEVAAEPSETPVEQAAADEIEDSATPAAAPRDEQDALQEPDFARPRRMKFSFDQA